ncbi:MAG TPA: hypothetical protein VIK81_03125 [Patescibacteria group bacterium]
MIGLKASRVWVVPKIEPTAFKMLKEIHEEVVAGLGKLLQEIHSRVDNVPSDLFDLYNLSQDLFLRNIDLFIASGGVAFAFLGLAKTFAVYKGDISQTINEERKMEELEQQIQSQTNPEMLTVEEERLKTEVLTIDGLQS